MAGEAAVAMLIAPFAERLANKLLGDPRVEAQRKDDLFNRIVEQANLGVDPTKILGSSKDLEGFFNPQRTAYLMGIPKTQAFQQAQREAQQRQQLGEVVGAITSGLTSPVLQFQGGVEQAQQQLPQAPLPTPPPGSGIIAQQQQFPAPTPEGPTLGRRPATGEEVLQRVENLSIRQLGLIDRETAAIEQRRQAAEGRQMTDRARQKVDTDLARRGAVLRLLELGWSTGEARKTVFFLENDKPLPKNLAEKQRLFLSGAGGEGFKNSMSFLKYSVAV